MNRQEIIIEKVFEPEYAEKYKDPCFMTYSQEKDIMSEIERFVWDYVHSYMQQISYTKSIDDFYLEHETSLENINSKKKYVLKVNIYKDGILQNG